MTHVIDTHQPITRPIVEFCSQPEWLAMPVATRAKLRAMFAIPKSGSINVTQAFDERRMPYDRITSDGTLPEDLESAFNVVTALKYLEREYDPKRQYVFSELLPVILKKAGLELGDLVVPEVKTTEDPAAGVAKDQLPSKPKTAKPHVEGRAKIKIKQNEA